MNCYHKAANLYEDMSNIEITDLESNMPIRDGLFEPKAFCSLACRDQYYYNDIESEHWTKYVPRLNAFYKRQIVGCHEIRDNLFRKWILLREATLDNLVDDIRAYITHLLVGTIAYEHTRLVSPSLLCDSTIGTGPMAISVTKAGRNLLYIQGTDPFHIHRGNLDSYHPFYTRDVCSVFIVNRGILALLYDGSLYTTVCGADANAPIMMALEGGTGIIEVAYSEHTLVVLKEDGTVWEGNHPYGKLYNHITTLLPLPFGNDNISLSVVTNATVITKRDGTLWATGNTQWSSQHRTTLTRVPFYGGRVLRACLHPYLRKCFIITDCREIWEMSIDSNSCIRYYPEEPSFGQSETETIVSCNSCYGNDRVVSGTANFVMTGTGAVFYYNTNTIGQYGRDTNPYQGSWSEASFRIPLIPYDAHHVHKRFKTH